MPDGALWRRMRKDATRVSTLLVEWPSAGGHLPGAGPRDGLGEVGGPELGLEQRPPQLIACRQGAQLPAAARQLCQVLRLQQEEGKVKGGAARVGSTLTTRLGLEQVSANPWWIGGFTESYQAVQRASSPT